MNAGQFIHNFEYNNQQLIRKLEKYNKKIKQIEIVGVFFFVCVCACVGGCVCV